MPRRGPEGPYREKEAHPPCGRVLVIDDDEAVARLFGRILQHAQHDVVLALDSSYAQRLVASQQFDVVVSDVSMPGVDGFQLLEQIRMQDESLPVILVTGRPADDLEHRAKAGGALHLLPKPLTAGRLREVVLEALSERRPRARPAAGG